MLEDTCISEVINVEDLPLNQGCDTNISYDIWSYSLINHYKPQDGDRRYC